jgi:hypothetical protein
LNFRLPYERDNGAHNQIPVPGNPDRNHGLNIKDVLDAVILGAGAKVTKLQSINSCSDPCPCCA